MGVRADSCPCYQCVFFPDHVYSSHRHADEIVNLNNIWKAKLRELENVAEKHMLSTFAIILFLVRDNQFCSYCCSVFYEYPCVLFGVVVIHVQCSDQRRS